MAHSILREEWTLNDRNDDLMKKVIDRELTIGRSTNQLINTSSLEMIRPVSLAILDITLE